MSEYIKKEDVLKALHDFWDECIGYDGSGTEMMLDNESVINSLPTYSFPDLSDNKGEWIPVSERLPEKDMACLVAVGKFDLTQMAIYSDLMGIIDHRIFYQGDYGRENFEDITEYVKAWQPLPEPYKKGE